MISRWIGFNCPALLAVFVLLLPGPCRAQSPQRVELFGGYAYANTNNIDSGSGVFICPGLNCPILYSYFGSAANLNGWEASVAVPLNHLVSAVADTTGIYGNTNIVSSLTINGDDTLTDRQHLSSYLFGPQFSSHKRLAGFGQALVGVVHESHDIRSAQFSTLINPAPATCLGAAIGGGLDLRLTHHLAVRPVQFRLLITRFDSSDQFQPTVSSGLVLHL